MGWCHSTGYSRNRGGTGDFHRPYEGSEVFTFHHSSNDTPSVTPIRACQLPQKGSLVGAFPAPSLRELSSECETEGVYFDERNHSKITEPIMAGV